MNKIIIPTILAATILIAGAFTMMPIEKAATIHSSTAFTTDIDNDGDLNPVDNCIIVDNPNQIDTDADLRGDACDLTPGVADP